MHYGGLSTIVAKMDCSSYSFVPVTRFPVEVLTIGMTHQMDYNIHYYQWLARVCCGKTFP